MTKAIYVRLLDEIFWRPVPSKRVSDDVYVLGKVEGVAAPEDELWEFPPGTRVKVAKRVFAKGETELVAVAKARRDIAAVAPCAGDSRTVASRSRRDSTTTPA